MSSSPLASTTDQQPHWYCRTVSAGTVGLEAVDPGRLVHGGQGLDVHVGTSLKAMFI